MAEGGKVSGRSGNKVYDTFSPSTVVINSHGIEASCVSVSHGSSVGNAGIVG